MRCYDRRINYYETDQMGIVHHSNYARFFEEARISYMDQMGYPYERLECEDIISPVLSISCKFIHALKFGDRIRIAVRLVSLTRVKCSFSYEITDPESGEIKARGTSEHGFITKEGKAVVLPRDREEFYGILLDELENEEVSK